MNLTRILAVGWIVMESLTVGHSQGLIIFNNRVSGEVDARVTFPDGTPVGAGFTAQLYGGPAGTPVDLLTPLLPTTTFRTGAAMGYIFQVEVRVPGVPRFEDATVQMRVYDGESWESSLIRGDSNIITLTTISETWPSEYLIGLRPFQNPRPAMNSSGDSIFGIKEHGAHWSIFLWDDGLRGRSQAGLCSCATTSTSADMATTPTPRPTTVCPSPRSKPTIEA
jgi:hypothetical protein